MQDNHMVLTKIARKIHNYGGSDYEQYLDGHTFGEIILHIIQFHPTFAENLCKISDFKRMGNIVIKNINPSLLFSKNSYDSSFRKFIEFIIINEPAKPYSWMDEMFSNGNRIDLDFNAMVQYAKQGLTNPHRPVDWLFISLIEHTHYRSYRERLSIFAELTLIWKPLLIKYLYDDLYIIADLAKIIADYVYL